VSLKVLFVCVENSFRSQIAEAIARQRGAGRVEPFSAGSKPSGQVNPTAIEVMKERGVDLSANKSKGLSDLPAQQWDYVVTMGCGDACPFVPAKKRLDWKIPDPKALPKSEFHKVVDMIEAHVLELIHESKTA
jgi:arsenate reductase (thioredoxin)